MQTEKKSLSKREQVMMLALVVIAVVAVMILYVIIPSYNKLIDKTDELNDLEFERIQVISSIAAEVSIRDNHDTLVAQHGINSSRFLAESMASEIGRMLTSLCDMHELQPIDQSLQPPVDFFIEPDEDTGSNAPAPGKDSVFLITTATMTLRGEYYNLMRLLDTVERIDYIRISRVTYVKSQDVTLSADRMVVQFEVTMLKDVKP